MRFEQNGKTASAIHPMRIRAEPDQRYPVRVCEYDIPSSGVVDCVELVAEDDSALGTAFPLLTYDIDRVYMVYMYIGKFCVYCVNNQINGRKILSNCVCYLYV